MSTLPPTLQKLNFDIPKRYACLRVTMHGIDYHDNIPTTIYVKMSCHSKSGVEKHVVCGVPKKYGDFHKTDAIINQVRQTVKIVNKKIPFPSDRVEFVIGDLAAYLLLTRGIYPVNYWHDSVLTKIKAGLDKWSVKVLFKFEKLIEDNYTRKTLLAQYDFRKTTPTLEQLGQIDREFFEQEMEKRKTWI